MIKSKLHNPIIAQNSQLENAVVQKVNNENELTFSDLSSAAPVVPETGRIWFNTDKGQFHFANIGKGGNDKNYVDTFLSRTDLRHQDVVSAIDFQNTFKVNATDKSNILTIDSGEKTLTVHASTSSTTLTADTNVTVGGKSNISVAGIATETYGSDKSENVSGKFDRNVTGTYSSTIASGATEKFLSTLTRNISGDVVETVGANVTISVTGDVSETYSNNVHTDIAKNLSLKVGAVATVLDGLNNVKISANNNTNTLAINYANMNFSGQVEIHAISNKFVINDGSTDKFIIDNSNNKVTVNYNTVETTTSKITASVTSFLAITNGVDDKIVANHINDDLAIRYSEVTVTGNTTVDGNMLITGDLTIGGQTTKVDVKAENLMIADNVIVLNSNLTNVTDPRLASAIADGTDVDHNAGVSVNRGSEGVLDLIKWVESTDTTSVETLKQAVSMTSIWNYESATPAYELHQIIDAYTLARKTQDKSGTSWVGYDGYQGLNYTASVSAGASPFEVLDYSYKLDAAMLDTTIDAVAQEIDTIKFDKYNTKRVGETPSAGIEFTITHNLGTVFVQVITQREDSGKWFFDIMPVQVLDQNTIKIAASEPTKIRYMISAIEGFDINQATDLVII